MGAVTQVDKGNYYPKVKIKDFDLGGLVEEIGKVDGKDSSYQDN